VDKQQSKASPAADVTEFKKEQVTHATAVHAVKQEIHSPIVRQLKTEVPRRVENEAVWNVADGIQELKFSIDYSNPIPAAGARPRREYRPAFGSLDCPMSDQTNEFESQVDWTVGEANMNEGQSSDTTIKRNTLEEAEFNEQESHESFLEALNEWRNSGKAKKDTNPAIPSTLKSANESCGTATQSQLISNNAQSVFTVEFKSAMSYFDKLHLQDLRRGIPPKIKTE
jgi:hypothetical protein